MDTIITLKRQRAFSAVVRDGIRLIVDLKDKKLDVLYEMFPWVIERLAQGSVIINSPPPGGNSKALEDKIARLEDLLLSITVNGRLMISDISHVQSTIPASAGQGKPAPAPVMKVAAVASADEISSNFLNQFLF